MMAMTGIYLLSSCGSAGDRNVSDNGEGKIKQLADGTFSLKLDNADCYSNVSNPSGNTAEWSVVVSKSGRFDVWMTSATKDTTDLKYQHPVLISIADNNLEAKPVCDRIVRNSGEVSYPWFRADSFLGSLYIQDTGTYYVQVISEKIFSKDHKPAELTGEEISKLISVSFTPVIR